MSGIDSIVAYHFEMFFGNMPYEFFDKIVDVKSFGYKLVIGTVLGADVTASDASCGDENGEAQKSTNGADKPKTVEFKSYQPKYRKRGTGSVHQVSKNVWEGRYTPTVNGKRIARNIYADSEEECEVKLEALIQEMKAEFGIR